MDIQEEIARAILPMFDQLATAVYHDGPYSEADGAVEAAAALMPLVRRAQAEALREASTNMRTCGDHHPACLRCQDADALWKRADRIEKEGAGA